MEKLGFVAAFAALAGLSGCAAGGGSLPEAPSYASQTPSPYGQPQQGYAPPGYSQGYNQQGYVQPAYGQGSTQQPGAAYAYPYGQPQQGYPQQSQPQQGSAYPYGYQQGAGTGTQAQDIAENYIIGALDELTIFVWRNPELGAKVQVRPDGRITTPLITDMPAAGKTPTQLARDIRQELTKYINDPLVNVIVSGFAGNYQQQVQIIGATEKPASLNYRANMTLLDALIAVGGLSEFAAGNRAKLSRLDRTTGQRKEYRLRIEDLLEDGDMRANVLLQPGDVITIPTSMF